MNAQPPKIQSGLDVIVGMEPSSQNLQTNDSSSS